MAEQLSDRLGIEITSWDPQRVVATLPLPGEVLDGADPAGDAHRGGAGRVGQQRVDRGG